MSQKGKIDEWNPFFSSHFEGDKAKVLDDWKTNGKKGEAYLLGVYAPENSQPVVVKEFEESSLEVTEKPQKEDKPPVITVKEVKAKNTVVKEEEKEEQRQKGGEGG